MIVSCPACHTRFKVDPALLKPDGRKVRCAKCAHVWRVRRDGTPTPTGQFALRPPKPASQQAAAAEPSAAAPAAADTAVAPRPASESAVAAAAVPSEAGGKTDVGGESAGASGTPAAATATPPEAAAAATKPVEQAAPRKGGRKFKIFLLVLCLVVIALFALGVVTGRFGPGGVAPKPGTPSTGDVAPPATGTGIRALKPDAAAPAGQGERAVVPPGIQ